MRRSSPMIPYYLLAAALILLLCILPAGAESPTVMVADYTITPSVLQPGDVGTITATIRNTAGMASVQQGTGIQTGGAFENIRSTDISVNIESVQIVSTDVEVISGNYKRIGAIGPGQSIPITFLIRAPMQDGIYFPEIWIDVTGGQSVRQPIPLNVNTQIALVKKPALTAIKTVPEGVNPGEDAYAHVVLKNDGLSRAELVTIAVNCSSPTITQKTPSIIHVGSLDKGENATVDMIFATDKNTPIGINRVCLSITYVSPDGTTTTQDETLVIHVKGRARIGIASLSSDPVQIRSGDTVTLVIRLENTGTDNANSVRAAIDLPVSGTKEAFIGRIEPDNDAPAVFIFRAGDPGEYRYNLTIQYEDDYGVQTRTESLQMAVQGGNSVVLFIAAFLVIVLAGAGAYWYLARARKGSGDA